MGSLVGMVVFCDMRDVVAGGRRFNTSAETEGKPSKISGKESMVSHLSEEVLFGFF